MVAICFVEMEIEPKSVVDRYNYLLQSVTIQFRMLFKHISYCKVQQSSFMTKRNRLLLQSVSGITKCDRLLL